MHGDDFGSGGCHVWILHSLCMCVCVCLCTGMAVLVLVTLHVQGQVVRAGEAAAAGDTLEGFGPSVFPVVSGELIRSGKTPVAVLPCASVRLLAYKTQQRRGELAMYKYCRFYGYFCVHNILGVQYHFMNHFVSHHVLFL